MLAWKTGCDSCLCRKPFLRESVCVYVRMRARFYVEVCVSVCILLCFATSEYICTTADNPHPFNLH